MKVLGIETSCDETAASVVEDGQRLLSNVVASSMDLHVQYGGVVPEIAARSHIEVILPVIQQALYEADCTWDDIDAIAVTQGAGLGGSLLIGVLTARTLAIAHEKPLYAINHVEGHVYANFLTETSSALAPNYELRTTNPTFPMLAIIVSGGHSQLALFENHFDYTLLGQTHDDAIGEAFDKVAKMLGLPYPGGPSVSKAALKGDPQKYTLPKAKMGPRRVQHGDEVQGSSEQRKAAHSTVRQLSSAADNAAIRAVVDSGKYDFSFSGLKTAVLRLAQSQIGESHAFPSTKLSERLSEAQKNDIAASFQRTAIETIVDKAKLAVEEFQPKSVVIAGGVAANQELRRQLTEGLPLPIEFPDLKLCTDNGAMIATLGCFKAMNNQPTADPYTLDIAPNLSM
ncbi:MAG: tRNA (adenosine(37)-N6)-threonylcarbamoyltransferase complex transferase subunit TsaD [Candidatus Saccharimonadales bacterium]